MVEVCIEVKMPDIECPVVYPIEFVVETTQGCVCTRRRGNFETWRLPLPSVKSCSICPSDV